ncbi:MAG: hypothetical protein PHV16_05200 [Candidatus Nanoarchaeia archaeon]|nr:hypothetical protein [Candidatus Nanoarchaeia archaeon]
MKQQFDEQKQETKEDKKILKIISINTTISYLIVLFFVIYLFFYIDKISAFVIALIAIISYLVFYSTPKKRLEMCVYYKSCFKKWKNEIWMLFLGLFLIASTQTFHKVNNIEFGDNPLWMFIGVFGVLVLATYIKQPNLSFLKSR